nr:MAG: hypothetical protein [Bacteriophage sp.]
MIKQIEELEQQNNMLTQSNRKYGEIQFDLKLQVKNLQEANTYLIESNRLLQTDIVNLRTKLSNMQGDKQTETSS